MMVLSASSSPRQWPSGAWVERRRSWARWMAWSTVERLATNLGMGALDEGLEKVFTSYHRAREITKMARSLNLENAHRFQYREWDFRNP